VLEQRNDRYFFILFYFISLAITVYQSIHIGLSFDQDTEYNTYLYFVKTGLWLKDGLIASSFFSVYLPGMIERVFHIGGLRFFEVFPCIFYSFMPPFVYLISKVKLDTKSSIVAALFVLSNYFFVGNSNIGRVSVALGFMAVLIWCLIKKKYTWSAVFCVCVVLSHYTTAFITFGLLLALLLYNLFRHQEIKKLAIVAGVMVLGIVLWFGLLTGTPLQYGKVFLNNSLTEESDTLKRPTVDFPNSYSPEEIDGLKREFAESSPAQNFLRLESREAVVQLAFGKTFWQMSWQRKFQFILSWFAILLLTYGLYLSVRKKLLSGTHLILAVSMYLILVITVIIPHISVYYGIMRVYVTAVAALASCWAIGTRWMGFYPQCAFLVIYSLCTSGTLKMIGG
jgi:hypothetical protein